MSIPKNSIVSFLYIVATALPWVVTPFVIYFLQGNEAFFADPTFSFMVIFYALAAIAMGLSISHTSFIAVLSGYYFSWWWFPALVLSYLTAAMLGLTLGKWLNKEVAGGYLDDNPRFHDFLEKLKGNTFLLVLFSRLSPIFPFAFMNMALASINIPLRGFLSGSLVGMVPRTAVFVYTGSRVDDIWAFVSKPSLDGAFALMPVVLILISTIGMIWLVRKSMK